MPRTKTVAPKSTTAVSIACSAVGSLTVTGCLDVIFANSVFVLHERGLLDTSVVHGDGTTTAAKKGGDNIGFSGHKHLKGSRAQGR